MAELTRNINNLVTRIEQIEQRPPLERCRPPPGGDDDNDDLDLDDDADVNAHNRRRLNFNRRGMGGNNNDPFAKVKFSLPPFAGMFILRHI